jgi:hypothetical protein
MSHLVIRRLRVPHCKRGPARCAACRAGDVLRLCLLDVDPLGADRIQRPVIEVRVDGALTWRPYDVLRSFADEAEALRHARESGVTDIRLEG